MRAWLPAWCDWEKKKKRLVSSVMEMACAVNNDRVWMWWRCTEAQQLLELPRLTSNLETSVIVPDETYVWRTAQPHLNATRNALAINANWIYNPLKCLDAWQSSLIVRKSKKCTCHRENHRWTFVVLTGWLWTSQLTWGGLFWARALKRGPGPSPDHYRATSLWSTLPLLRHLVPSGGEGGQTLHWGRYLTLTLAEDSGAQSKPGSTSYPLQAAFSSLKGWRECLATQPPNWAVVADTPLQHWEIVQDNDPCTARPGRSFRRLSSEI